MQGTSFPTVSSSGSAWGISSHQSFYELGFQVFAGPHFVHVHENLGLLATCLTTLG